MAYSKHVQTVLERGKVRITDRIAVTKGGKTLEGLLMPRPGIGDPDSLVIKLDNGYNIGIRVDKGTKVEKSKHREPKAIKEEEEFELGKLKAKKVRFNQKKPAISMIATGGTITSRVDYRTGGVTSLSNPADILQNVPELVDIVNIKDILSPFTIMSESMTHEHWQMLAKEGVKELNKSDIKGVIVTHGTDNLHVTSAALSFFLKNLNKPVAVVGSQRSTDRGSSDGGMNLVCASHVALSNMAEVGVCMHGSMEDTYCLFTRGTKVRKMDTQRRDAFRPVNDLPFARVYADGKIEAIQSANKRNSGKVILDSKFEPKVAIIKSYPGCSPKIIDYYVKHGYKGLVLEATGLGQFPTSGKNSWLKTLKSASESGVFLCATAETIYGRLNPNVYSEGRMCRDQGVVYLGDTLTETAYVKLGWILAKTKDMKKVGEMMLTSYKGEISERTLPETFLY